MALLFRGWRGLVLALCAGVMLISPASNPVAQTSTTGPAPVAPNFDLGSRWTAAKVGKLVFDTSVTPHWLQSGDASGTRIRRATAADSTSSIR